MREFLGCIFILLLTGQSWATATTPEFTLTCDDTAGNGCKIDGDYEEFVVSKCTDIKKFSKYHPIVIDTTSTGELCATDVGKVRRRPKFDCSDDDIVARYVNGLYVIACESGGYLTTLGTKYDAINDADWSYEEKTCVGSGGVFGTDNTCSCPDGTEAIAGECICTNGNTKYLTNNNCHEGNACLSTGGKTGSNGNCTCPQDKNLIDAKIRDNSDEIGCQCKSGYHYRDPMRRWEGCVEIGETINISGSIVDYKNNESLPYVNISVKDASLDSPMGKSTDIHGQFVLQNVPNTAYVTISMVGFRAQTHSAMDLQKEQTIKLVQEDTILNDVAVVEQSLCTESGGTPNENDPTKCDCPDGKVVVTMDRGVQLCENVEEKSEIPSSATQPATPTTTVPKSSATSLEEAAQKLKAAQEKYDAARAKEQSWANKSLTAVSSAATGLGAMQAASAWAEQDADNDAEEDMRAYIVTMKCEYGGGQPVTLGNEDVTLPGGNDLLNLYTEYKQIAERLKQTKTALGLRHGIESEVLYDKAQTGLYQNAAIGKTGGGYTSLYNALTDETSADATAWTEQTEKTAQKLKTGAIVAGAGVATGIIGNYLINERNQKKEEFQKAEKEIQQTFSTIVIKFETSTPPLLNNVPLLKPYQNYLI